MSLFQLDPESAAARARTQGRRPAAMSLSASIGYAIVGFTILSVAGFVPWAVFGRALHRAVGEAGMYAACAAVFIGLSGPLLHRLILGPGSLGRFYALFTMTFIPYSIAWIAAWMGLGGHLGSLVGLLIGTGVMGALLAWAFGVSREMPRVILALFVLNTAGYFIGGWIEGWLIGLKDPSFLGYAVTRKSQVITAMLMWGVCYGIGFGAGLGYAFHRCQHRTRALLDSDVPSPESGVR